MTSQIFANIYLNEFDQFVLHDLKPLGYVRYGDDFVLWLPDEAATWTAQVVGGQFLSDELRLAINLKQDLVQPTSSKLLYLGVDLWPNGRRLAQRVQQRIDTRLGPINISSYQAITRQHLPERYHKRLLWTFIDNLDET